MSKPLFAASMAGWCNGSIAVSLAADSGSSPDPAPKRKTSPIKACFWSDSFVLF